jgi:cytoskeletal protein CcmA (bactofilin family)
MSASPLLMGYFDGNLRAMKQVERQRHARVFGNIHTPSLAIRDGAVFMETRSC